MGGGDEYLAEYAESGSLVDVGWCDGWLCGRYESRSWVGGGSWAVGLRDLSGNLAEYFSNCGVSAVLEGCASYYASSLCTELRECISCNAWPSLLVLIAFSDVWLVIGLRARSRCCSPVA